MSDHADIGVQSPETVKHLRDAGPQDLVWLLADSHELLRAERDTALAENSRLRGQLSEIAHTNAPVIRDLGARALAAEAAQSRVEALACRWEGKWQAAEARVTALEAALAVYADHRHWGIEREFALKE